MHKTFILVSLSALSLLSTSLFAAEQATAPKVLKKNTIIVKLGTFDLANTDQTIVGFKTTFEKSSSSVYDIEYNRKFGNNFAYGGEILHYTNKYQRILPGETSTYVLTGNIKKYFALAKHFEPFIGAGIGFNATSVSGSLDGGAVGLAASLSVGAEIPFDYVGIHLEYRYVSTTAENDTTTGQTAKFDLAGSALLAGVAIHF